MSEVFDYLESNKDKFVSDLIELLKIPSVSADPAFKQGVRQAAGWMVSQFESLGLKTELLETAGHPIVYAESEPVAGKPVVLVYGHYDVQPPDPLEEWITPPFEPQIRDGNLYARGATDDKGQMLTHVKSVEAWLKTVGSLPVQVKFLIEGEEEVGSASLVEYISQNQEKLACDCVVISDSGQFAKGIPAITYGLRGIAYLEVYLQGPAQDLHSGTFGGGVTNPANTLTKLLGSLVDENGKIQVPGFYDQVVPLTEKERAQFNSLPFDEEAFNHSIGVKATTGEAGYSNCERRWARPTCDINGLWSGYQGEGAKTVLPAKAGAKFSFRLVPDQDPALIGAAVKKYFEEMLPPGITMKFIEHHGAGASAVSIESPYMAAAAAAIETGFKKPPVFIREGGSIPIVKNFSEELDADVLLLGWGLNDDNMHSPNEKFTLTEYHQGIKSSAALWPEIAKINKKS